MPWFFYITAILLQNKILYQEREKIIEGAQKNREAGGDPDNNQGQASRLLARRPVDVTQLRQRLTEEFFYPGKHRLLFFLN
jgi:hypothetical protein